MTTVAFDVDGTLIFEVNDTPRFEVIDMFRGYEKFGCEMFIWSAEGIDYAEKWRDKLGLDAKVVEKGSFTPDISYDDIKACKLGRVNICVGNPIIRED